MVSGFASYFYEQLGINSVVMSIIMAILCFITFNKNIEGITKVNTILIPFLIVFIVISAILNSKCFINNFNYKINRKFKYLFIYFKIFINIIKIKTKIY